MKFDIDSPFNFAEAFGHLGNIDWEIQSINAWKFWSIVDMTGQSNNQQFIPEPFESLVNWLLILGRNFDEVSQFGKLILFDLCPDSIVRHNLGWRKGGKCRGRIRMILNPCSETSGRRLALWGNFRYSEILIWLFHHKGLLHKLRPKI